MSDQPSIAEVLFARRRRERGLPEVGYGSQQAEKLAALKFHHNGSTAKFTFTVRRLKKSAIISAAQGCGRVWMSIPASVERT